MHCKKNGLKPLAKIIRERRVKPDEDEVPVKVYDKIVLNVSIINSCLWVTYKRRFAHSVIINGSYTSFHFVSRIKSTFSAT